MKTFSFATLAALFLFIAGCTVGTTTGGPSNRQGVGLVLPGDSSDDDLGAGQVEDAAFASGHETSTESRHEDELVGNGDSPDTGATATDTNTDQATTTADGDQGDPGGGDPVAPPCNDGWRLVKGLPSYVWKRFGGYGRSVFGKMFESAPALFDISNFQATNQQVSPLVDDAYVAALTPQGGKQLLLGTRTDGTFVLEERMPLNTLAQFPGSPVGLCGTSADDVYIVSVQPDPGGGSMGTVRYVSAAPWAFDLSDFEPTLIRCFGAQVFVGGKDGADLPHLYEVTGGSAVEILLDATFVELRDLVGFSADDLWLAGVNSDSASVLAHVASGAWISTVPVPVPLGMATVDLKYIQIDGNALVGAGEATDDQFAQHVVVIDDMLGGTPSSQTLDQENLFEIKSFWLSQQGGGRRYINGVASFGPGASGYKTVASCQPSAASPDSD